MSVAVAYRHARWVIAFERYLGVFHEAQIQHWLLAQRPVIGALDVWYGSTQFLVTAVVLVVLYFGYPRHYRRWRNTLAVTTALALAGFAFFPLMPPRLLPAHYGFVDTLQTVGGLWAFNSGPMSHVTNQYAAMPSLHCAWALWCALATSAVLKHRWSKTLTMVYPAITVVCIIVTANHYFTDAAAGALIVGVGYGTTRTVGPVAHKRWRRHRRSAAAPEVASHQPSKHT